MANVKVNLKRVNDAYHFEAVNEDSIKVNIDASPEVGGVNKGFRPMQLLLAALGGCAAIDIVGILKKQRQQIDSFNVEVSGEREESGTYNLYRKIRIHFILKGNIDKGKAERAAQLSLGKYCSVAKTLENTATIIYRVSVK